MKKPPPEKYYNISQTQLSPARLFGGANVNGRHYVYDPTDDSLTLASALKKRKKP